MKILRRVALSVLLFTLAVILAVIVTSRTVPQAAHFFCSSANVTCLLAGINKANRVPDEHAINLEPGNYTLPVHAALRDVDGVDN